MSDIHQQILDTEQALTSILDELKDLKDATSQIDNAKEMSQRVIRASEEINTKMVELLSTSEAFLKYLEKSQISEELEKIGNQGSYIKEFINFIAETQSRMNQDSLINHSLRFLKG